MDIAALILWVLTATGGFVLLARWVAEGGARISSTTQLPPAAVFGHFLLAAAGLAVWIVYVVNDMQVQAWIAVLGIGSWFPAVGPTFPSSSGRWPR